MGGRRIYRRLAGLVLVCALLVGALPTAHAADAPTVQAAGAIVVDFDTGAVYYEKDADLARPVASMTKLMSLYLVFEEIAAWNFSMDRWVTASQYAADISNDPVYSGHEGLVAGEKYWVETLVELITTASCNGSMIVLAEQVGGGSEETFVQRMNDTAAGWGIEAHFADACGFVSEGNAVTPRAMAYIARRIITDFPYILDYTSLTSTEFQGKTFYTTNTLMREGRVEGIDGLKSGTTKAAGCCFTGTAQRHGRRIISVVLNAPSDSARMADTQALLEYGFACRMEWELRQIREKVARSRAAVSPALEPRWEALSPRLLLTPPFLAYLTQPVVETALV